MCLSSSFAHSSRISVSRVVTRVYVMIEFSYVRGGMCNLAYIGATVLNFELAWPADVCASKTLAHDPALSVYYL